MLITIFGCLLLVGLCTLLHYEVLRWLAEQLPRLTMPVRLTPLLAVFGCFFAHTLEIGLYGGGLWLLLQADGVGHMQGPGALDLATALFFAAEMYTSIGFGSIEPVGPVRMFVGTAALHGLLLIGWSASYLYIAMERYWKLPSRSTPHHRN